MPILLPFTDTRAIDSLTNLHSNRNEAVQRFEPLRHRGPGRTPMGNVLLLRNFSHSLGVSSKQLQHILQ